MNHSTQQTRKKIAVYYPAFSGGGAEAVGLWILEALHQDYDLTLFTMTNPNFQTLDSMYGTHLATVTLKIDSLLPPQMGALVNTLISNNDKSRLVLFHWLIRHLKQQQQHYDLTISGYNAVDFGQQGLNYIHWVKVLEGDRMAESISGFDANRVKESGAIANSAVVQEAIRKTYATESVVVYPPVVIDVQNIPWEEKEDAFICSGRLVKSKEPHRAIQILQQVRAKGFPVRLYLTGGGGGIYGWRYRRFLQKLVNENADWVTLCENLPYADYVKVLSRCRYGIHYKKEPFGISIAEMVKAGAVPFVRDQGGQMEIVGSHNTDLLFGKPEEAIAKIVQVLQDGDRLRQLRESLEQQKHLFSTEKFMGEIKQAVAHQLN
ncbi:MAG: glycosyltransferase [Leptolyngbyaceae cyanobacterium]